MIEARVQIGRVKIQDDKATSSCWSRKHNSAHMNVGRVRKSGDVVASECEIKADNGI